VPVRGVLSHGGLRKGNQEVAVITGVYRSPGIADLQGPGAGLPRTCHAGYHAGLASAGTKGQGCLTERCLRGPEERRDRALCHGQGQSSAP